MPNPTNGSWWKFHLPPKTRLKNESSTNCRWWDSGELDAVTMRDRVASIRCAGFPERLSLNDDVRLVA
ncbi:MAG TPA: hypothetical protein VFZ22_22950, partial [Pyrinomonadaceae bacterium]|nr:hypothetical protein [Pyrinomonadaceae bacterium]